MGQEREAGAGRAEAEEILRRRGGQEMMSSLLRGRRTGRRGGGGWFGSGDNSGPNQDSVSATRDASRRMDSLI